MKTLSYKLSAIIFGLALAFGLVAPAFAADLGLSTNVSATGGTATLGVKAQAKLSAVEAKLGASSTAEIEKRVTDLTGLSGRINAMVHVDAATKASLSASLQADITALTNLKAKISADTDAATLKADVASITDAYRIYVLVGPQTRILAAADRASTIGDMITALNVNLETRITAAQAAGKDVSTIVAAQTDMTSKVADAKLQASTAISAVSGLTPDNGDAAKLAANTAALKQARADINVAATDLKEAQKDVKTIIAAIKGFGITASTSASTSTQ